MNLLKLLLGVAGKMATSTGNAFSPHRVGSRRGKVSLATFYVGVAFVLAAHFLHLSDAVIMSVLALGGVPATALVVGESAADVRGRSAQK